ncbi:unnamed protein product [Alopecurus aequalis]
MSPPTNGGHAGQERPRSTFHPCLWDDFFLTYRPPLSAQKPQMQERAGVLTEQVRTLIKDTNAIPKILDLTISLERLGLEYHYEDEISQLLDVVFNSDYDDDNLHLVSLRFYILRKNGYDVASDVFNKFQDKEGNFINFDTKSMLSLYNAAHVGTHEDEVLDKAISFSKRYLMGVLEHLESPMAHEVSASLVTPLFKRVGILEARSYIPNYAKETTRNEAIFELAKLKFNLLQLQFCDELKEVTIWWKELYGRSNLSFVRHRVVETYFWMNGACYKPQYSHSRIILAKITYFITILDDIFDTYGSTTESIQLQQAINRWDESEVDRLPEYLKAFYLYILETFSSFEDELGHDKSYRVFYLRELLKQLVQTYAEELRWRDENYVPKTLGEHLEVSSTSIGAFLIACAAYTGMDDITTEETFKWVLGHPQLIKSLGIFVRLSNDIVSNERERAGHQCASTVQCYMKEHGATMYDACQQIKELAGDSWKDMLVHSLAVKNQPKVVPRTILYLAKTVHNMYKHNDGYTTSETIKDEIRLLFVEPI